MSCLCLREGQISALAGKSSTSPEPQPSCCLCRACLGQCFSYSVPNTFPQSTESLVHCDSCMPAQSMWEIVSILLCSMGPQLCSDTTSGPLSGLFPLMVSSQGISQVAVPCPEMPGWKELLEALLSDPLSSICRTIPCHSLHYLSLCLSTVLLSPLLPLSTCTPLGDLAVFDVQKFIL